MVGRGHQRKTHRHHPRPAHRTGDRPVGWSPRSCAVTVRPFPIAAGEITVADLAANGEAGTRSSTTGGHGETLPEGPQ